MTEPHFLPCSGSLLCQCCRWAVLCAAEGSCCSKAILGKILSWSWRLCPNLRVQWENLQLCFSQGSQPLHGAEMLLQPQWTALTWIQPVLTSNGVQGPKNRFILGPQDNLWIAPLYLKFKNRTLVPWHNSRKKSETQSHHCPCARELSWQCWHPVPGALLGQGLSCETTTVQWAGTASSSQSKPGGGELLTNPETLQLLGRGGRKDPAQLGSFQVFML